MKEGSESIQRGRALFPCTERGLWIHLTQSSSFSLYGLQGHNVPRPFPHLIHLNALVWLQWLAPDPLTVPREEGALTAQAILHLWESDYKKTTTKERLQILHTWMVTFDSSSKFIIRPRTANKHSWYWGVLTSKYSPCARRRQECHQFRGSAHALPQSCVCSLTRRFSVPLVHQELRRKKKSCKHQSKWCLLNTDSSLCLFLFGI